MIEGLALALMKSLAAFLFKSYVTSQSIVKIDGAPSWYMQKTGAQVCVYDFKRGGLEAVDSAKAAAFPKMEKELAGILVAVIYENYSDLKDPKELKFVMAFKNDSNAPVFVRKNMTFPAIEYKKKYSTAFVKACIEKDTILEYQGERIETIRYELTHKRADDAFEEMESSDKDFKLE